MISHYLKMSLITSMATFGNKDVEQWLKDVFEDDDIPEFEWTAELDRVLMKYMAKNKEAEKDAHQIMKTEHKYSEIYKEKAAVLSSLAGVEVGAEATSQAESVAAMANRLNLQEPTLTNFLLALNAAENREFRLREQELIEGRHLATLSRKVTQAMKTNDLLRRDLKMLEGIVEPHEAHKMKVAGINIFLDKKIDDYTYRTRKYEKNLSKRNYDPLLQHHQLLQRSECVKDLEKEVQSLKSNLDSFQSLPPNESLTQLKIQTARDELSALQDDFQKMLETETSATTS